MSDSPAMTSAPRLCPKCGAEIPSDAPEGGCPSCLLQNGLGVLPDACDASTVISTKADEDGSAENVEMDATAAGHSEKAAPSAATLGELGDYELLEVVGRGGQGVVYRAHQKSLNRTVALKMISVGSWATEAHLKRFRREAEAAASLEHPGIVPIYEVGERDGSCYFSMRFVEGGQLDQVIKREPMSIRQAAELISKVARTVHYAHEHGILHRDIKPGNILLDAKGEPLLTDFGLARLVEAESTVTRTKEVMGTPSYMAPEQAVGNNAAVSSATDVYGLGAVLYQLLTGHPPFAGGTTYETIKLVLDTEPRQPRLLNPKIDRDLSTICLKSLEKDPKRRYSSALALAEDLEHWLKHEPIQARRTGIFTRGKKWVRRNPAIAALTASLIAVAAITSWDAWQRELIRHPITNGVAVLPFENLSADPDNAYFAAGIQDEILSRLASIAALKVISRTSTQQYQSKPRNLREIAKQLGVAHIVEGSVQKAADQVRVNVQLINTQNDSHLWADTYDRKLTDIFAVESEIAKGIAAALQAKLTGPEEQALAVKPTNNPEAYDAHLRGLAYALRPGYNERDTLAAVEHFTQAVKLDPKFAVAWAWLARVSALGYFNSAGNDVPALRETAKDAVAKVTQLQPNLGEAFLAEGYFHYYCERNYDAALASFAKARQSAPKTSDALEALALVSRRTGDWQRSLEYFRQATEIDPRNISLLASYGETYAELREYSSALKVYDQLLEISPDNAEALAGKAAIYLSVANLSEAATLLSRMRYDPSSQNFFFQIWQRIYERRFADAIAMVKDAITTRDLPLGIKANYGWTLADLKAFTGDTMGARIAWQQVRDEVESLRRQTKGERFVFPPILAAAYAALGDERKALAIVDQVPVDALSVGGFAYLRARIALYAGNKDSAVEQLATSAHNPVPAGPGYSATYGDLKLNPVWDPLRGDPRFEKIVASLAPKKP
jgi:serine/threonine protein kinase/Tfp pilus assembly protein PilF